MGLELGFREFQVPNWLSITVSRFLVCGSCLVFGELLWVWFGSVVFDLVWWYGFECFTGIVYCFVLKSAYFGLWCNCVGVRFLFFGIVGRALFCV